MGSLYRRELVVRWIKRMIGLSRTVIEMYRRFIRQEDLNLAEFLFLLHFIQVSDI